MVAPVSTVNEYEQFGGLDYRSNDLTRKSRFARDVLNVEYLKNNSISCRKGQKVRAKSQGGGGMDVYIRDDGGVAKEEILAIDEDLWTLTSGSLNIQYLSTGDAIAKLTPYNNAGTYGFALQLIENDIVLLNLWLGTGKDEIFPITVAQMADHINTTFRFSAFATGDSSCPAAAVDNFELSVTMGAGVSVPFEYFKIVYSPVAHPFSEFWAAVNTANFENASTQNTGNLFFIGTGVTRLQKYDSRAVYNAGVPAAGDGNGFAGEITAVVSGSGLTGQYFWFVTYEMTDALGIIIEGDASNIVGINLSSQGAAITIPMIQANTGFLVNAAKVNGNQSSTVITVHTGHTLKPGLFAWLVDTSGNPQQVEILSTTVTSITLASSVAVSDNDIISSGLKINLYRTIAGAEDTFQLVGEYPNNPFVSTATITDATPDASLGFEYEPPLGGHGLWPPGMKYLTSYQQLLIGSDGTDNIYYSDIDGPEFWPSLTAGSFTIRSKSNYPVRGIGTNREIFIAQKENETHVIQGTLSDGNFTQSLLADAIGTDSHHSILDVEGTLWFYNSKFGVRRIVGNALPDDVSYRVCPVFTGSDYQPPPAIASRRVIGVNYESRQQAIFFLPIEENGIIDEQASFIMVGDYRTQFEVDREYDDRGRIILEIPEIRWWKWDSMNMAGGAAIASDELVWTERHFSQAVEDYEYPLVRRCNHAVAEDYADFGKPINWLYDSGWADQNEPKVMKKVNRVAIFSFPEGVTPDFTITARTEINYLNGNTHSEFLVNFGQSSRNQGWGAAPYSVPPWGEPAASSRLFPLLPTRCEAIKIIFASDVWLQQPVISGWTWEMVPAYKPKVME